MTSNPKAFMEQLINDRLKTSDSLLEYNLNAKVISKAESKLIRRFLAYKVSTGKVSISANRAKLLTNLLCGLRRQKMVPDYTTVTTDDIKALFLAITAGNSPYKQNTQNQLFIIIGLFASYLAENEGFKLDIKQIKGINKPDENTDGIKPSDILTDADFDTLIAHCTTIRDKAIMAIFADCGPRPEEFMYLKWSDLQFTAESVRIRVTDAKNPSKWKMNYCIDRKQYLVDWQQVNEAAEPNQFVFRNFLNPKSLKMSDTPMSSQAVRKMVLNAYESSKIPFPPGYACRLLRTSNITNQIKKGLDLVAIMKSHWAAGLNSSMFNHYEKLADLSTEHMFLKKSGHKVVDLREKDGREAFICECGHENAPGKIKCVKCGSLLKKANSASDDRMAALEKELAEMKAFIMANMKSSPPQ